RERKTNEVLLLPRPGLDDLWVLQEHCAPLIGEAFDCARRRHWVAGLTINPGREGLRRIQFASICCDVIGNELLVFLDDRSKTFPVEPLLSNVANVAQVSRSEGGYSQ